MFVCDMREIMVKHSSFFVPCERNEKGFGLACNI